MTKKIIAWLNKTFHRLAKRQKIIFGLYGLTLLAAGIFISTQVYKADVVGQVSNQAGLSYKDAAGATASVVSNTVVTDVTSTDATPPVVLISSPCSNGTTVSGTITINATATDASGIKIVGFYKDTINESDLLGSDTASPYSASWNTGGDADGEHALIVLSWDNANNVGFAWVKVNVNNTGASTLPRISITAPCVGQTVSGTASVTATASDADGIKRVDFYKDSINTSDLILSDSTSPYSASWNSTTVANGDHVLLVLAYDNKDSVSLSWVKVRVSN